MKSRLPQEYMDKYRNKGRQVPQMTLYDLNRQMVKSLPPMDNDGKVAFINNIFNKFIEKDSNKYYMLLCKELSYFTVFHKDDINTDNFAETVHQLLSERGTIITAGWDNEENQNSIEYWVSVKTPIENNPNYTEIYCFYLFRYDEGIVEVQ